MPNKVSNDRRTWSNELIYSGVLMAALGGMFLVYQHYKKKNKKKNKAASLCTTYDSRDAALSDPSESQYKIRQEHQQEKDCQIGQQEKDRQPVEGRQEGQQEKEGRTEEGRQEGRQEGQQKVEEVREQQCSRDQYLAILKETINAMENSIRVLASKEDKLRKENTPDKTISEILNNDYKKEVYEARKISLEKHKTTEEQFLLAADKYNDEEIIEQRTKIEKIECALKGEPIPLPPDKIAMIPKEFTLDVLITLFEELFGRISTSHRETMEEVKRQLANSPEEEIQTLCNTRNVKKDLEIRTDIFKKYKIDEKVLDLAMQRYMHEPRLQETMMALQNKQQQLNKPL